MPPRAGQRLEDPAVVRLKADTPHGAREPDRRQIAEVLLQRGDQRPVRHRRADHGERPVDRPVVPNVFRSAPRRRRSPSREWSVPSREKPACFSASSAFAAQATS